MHQHLSDEQLGFATSNGCELAAHTARTYFTHDHDGTTAFLKIDYRNAFNMVDRSTFLTHVSNFCPEIFPFVRQCYEEDSSLFWNGREIFSQRGAQQGDPLGPVLFCLALKPITSILRSDVNLFYLDDGTMSGDPAVVLQDFATLIDLSSSIGLELNPEKCELAIKGQTGRSSFIQQFNAIAPGIQILSDDVELLGAPMTENAAIRMFEEKIKNSLRYYRVNLKDSQITTLL
jgi:Reverse transcriptase (RNA-dependent DNA polymerase)